MMSINEKQFNDVSMKGEKLQFALNRMDWLDNEITRYRDYEWKATSFYTGFLTALLLVLDYIELHNLEDHTKILLSFGTVMLLSISYYSITYIHLRLNQRKNNRFDLMEALGQNPIDKKITALGGFYDGWGVVHPIGFMIIITMVAIAVLGVLN